MISRVIVREPGLVIYKIYSGYWFFGRPTMEDLRQDLRAVTKKPAGLGHHNARTQSGVAGTWPWRLPLGSRSAATHQPPRHGSGIELPGSPLMGQG
jgi:hypothetical protein